VGDVRVHQLIGYWDGAGLSEGIPRAPSQNGKQTGNAQAPPNPQTLLMLAEKDPKSPFGLSSAKWIILNTPDGAEVDKAAAIILQNHLGSSNLVDLCKGLLRFRHRSSAKLLQSVLDKSPNPEVQAYACFALATLLKAQAKDGDDEPAAADAAVLFERVIRDYGQFVAITDNGLFELGGHKLADRAESELVELRRLSVGKEAPEIEGKDLDDRQMKLSDYRGKVVVLVFWGTWCGPCMAMVPDERKLVEHMAGKPFSLIGINADEDMAKVRAAVAKEKITWASFRDGDPGPIAKAWNVHGWPVVYVLDRKGVIRYRNVRGQDLADAVDKLLGQSRLLAQ
jgi:thiol-disulfide isomerase/thioredoxin